jgi:3-oxoacyl-ACP reductase-like protein
LTRGHGPPHSTNRRPAMATVVRGGRWASSPARPPPPPVVPAAATAAAGGDDSDVEPGGSAAIIALVLQRTQIGVAVYKEAESELLWSQCVFECVP